MRQTISAGGVVAKIHEGTPHILLIRDREHSDWVLPKGHVEQGESITEAALREVSEEAGMYHVKILHLLGTYQRLVKKTGESKTIYYYLMVSDANEEPQTTPDNQKDEIRWFPLNHLPAFYLPEQLDVIEKNQLLIEEYIKKTTNKNVDGNPSGL